ncbi:hypothetical protein KY289_001653 [Solanum tuberosum]|nr:hypothetical protein KY289_001653 [Solanum tuberosum]
MKGTLNKNKGRIEIPHKFSKFKTSQGPRKGWFVRYFNQIPQNLDGGIGRLLQRKVVRTALAEEEDTKSCWFRELAVLRVRSSRVAGLFWVSS